MNFLLIDDIPTVINAIENELTSKRDKLKVCTYPYDGDKDVEVCKCEIRDLIINEEIDFLVMNLKVIEEENPKKKQIADDLFKDGSIINYNTRDFIKIILVYTYDPESDEIDQKLGDLVQLIQEQIKSNYKNNVYSIETSTIFNKPLNSKLHPLFNTNHSLKAKNPENDQRILGSEALFSEYGKLIANAIYDFGFSSSDNLYSYSNPANLSFTEYVKLMNLNYMDDKVRIGGVSYFAKLFEQEEEYIIDIPYKEYYKKLNKELENTKSNDKLLVDFVRPEKKRWVYYDYNYLADQKKYCLYNITHSDDANEDEAKKWLPYLHSGVFHEPNAWNVKKLDKCCSRNGNGIKLLFIIRPLNIDKFSGYLNYTLWWESDESLSQDKIEKKIQDSLRIHFPLLKAKSAEILIPDLSKELSKHGTLSSIAEIINRNYAHHIGSHVSHRASFKRIMKRLGLTLEELNKIDDEEERKKTLATIGKMRNKLETYKDERSEFIAGITSTPVQQTFGLYRDVLLPFIENSLIIDNIAANENIQFRDLEDPDKDCLQRNAYSQSQLHVRLFIHEDLCHDEEVKSFCLTKEYHNDLTQVPEGFVEQKMYYFLKNDNEHPAYDSLTLPYYKEVKNLEDSFYEKQVLACDDIQLTMPGTLGKHTIYSMLENYIRNTAKHAYEYNEDNKTNPIEIIFKVKPERINVVESGRLILQITDNVSDAHKNMELSNGNEGNLVQAMNEKIETKLSEKDGLGIADMKICACLLGHLELTDENMWNSLKAQASEAQNLQYQLYLLRPCEVALINHGEEMIDKNQGIYYFSSLDDFYQDKSSNFKFAILNCNDIQVKDIKPNALPLKLLLLNAEDRFIEWAKTTKRGVVVDNIVNNDNGLTLIEKCWKKWINGKFTSKKVHLGLYLQQNDQVHPTNQIAKNAIDCFNDDDSFSFTVYHDHDDKIKPKLHKSNSEDQNLILFDRHAGMYRKIQENLDFKFLNDNFYEIIDKNNLDFDLISAAYNQDPFLLPFELLNAGLQKILIIDERIAEVAGESLLDTYYREFVESKNSGFKKKNIDKQGCTRFDACWAAGILLATDLGVNSEKSCKPLKSKYNQDDYNNLKVWFEKSDEKLEIAYQTNFIEHKCSLVYKNGKDQWECHDRSAIAEAQFQSKKDLSINIDCMIIHRTKLKELIDFWKKQEVDFLKELDIPKAFVVTGGGTVDFIPQSEKITILPTNILRDYVMGAKPAKYYLSKILN